MALGSKLCTNAIVLAMRPLRSAKAGLVVRVLGDLDPGKARAAALGLVGRDLDLTGEREHVGREPVAEQDHGVDLALRGKCLGFVQDGREAVQHLEKDRNRGLIHRHRHGTHRVLRVEEPSDICVRPRGLRKRLLAVHKR
jgi:hypothetical protein